MNLKKIKTIHFTGIKGVGMTALALAFEDLGKTISGSDTAEKFPTDAVLKQRKIKVKIGFAAGHLPKNCDLLIYTGAHNGANNPEVVAAKAKNIPVLAHSLALGELAQAYQVIAVGGVGGKSTTSALIAAVLDTAGFKPGFCVGVGNIPCLGVPGRLTKSSRFFVVEADEFVTDPLNNLTPRFLYLKPKLAVITNLEYDHPDVYPNLKSIYDSFKKFVAQAETVVINADNPRNREFIKLIDRLVITYGFSSQADWQIVKCHVADKKQFFQIKYKGILWPEMVLNLPGKYNVLNAVAAVAVANYLGADQVKSSRGLQRFTGTSRRFELIKSGRGISLYDDYAHHPTEIKALLAAARDWLPGQRLIVIFQSHTYSRTKALLSEFSRCFELADQVIINDIFASAREKDNLGMSAQILTQAIFEHQPQTVYCSGEKETIAYLTKYCRKNDAILTVGAGNNWLWHKQIIKALRIR